MPGGGQREASGELVAPGGGQREAGQDCPTVPTTSRVAYICMDRQVRESL
jgi:hypothetical protein